MQPGRDAAHLKRFERKQTMSRQLGPGDPFPKYTVSTTAGGRLNIPPDLTGEYGVIIFYRGVW
jgi:hypothetical protein